MGRGGQDVDEWAQGRAHGRDRDLLGDDHRPDDAPAYRQAQAEVPHALALALKEGRIGVMDYYNMNNILADTQMRETIGKTGPASMPQQPKSEEPKK